VTVNGEKKWLYVIPDNMRKATVVKFHDQRGHWSLDRTVAAILPGTGSEAYACMLNIT